MVVFDTTLSLAQETDWPMRGREFIVMAGDAAEPARARAVESRGGKVIRCSMEGGRVSVRDAVAHLAAMKFTRLLVEGGPRLFASFVAAQAWGTRAGFTSRPSTSDRAAFPCAHRAPEMRST